MNKNVFDAGTGAALLTFCLLAFYLTLSFAPPVLRGYPGAAFFPRLILTILGLMSVLLIARSLRRIVQDRSAEETTGTSLTGKLDGDAASPLWFLVAVALALVMAAAIPIVGFEAASVVYVGGLLFWRLRRPLPAILGALAVMLALYVLFVLALRVQLPLAFLPRYL